MPTRMSKPIYFRYKPVQWYQRPLFWLSEKTDRKWFYKNMRLVDHSTYIEVDDVGWDQVKHIRRATEWKAFSVEE